MSSNQNFWLDQLEKLGGQFWPPDVEDEDMPEVGARFPTMLYKGKEEVICYNEEEVAQAKKNGFDIHPSLKEAGEKNQAPKAQAEVKKPEKEEEIKRGG